MKYWEIKELKKLTSSIDTVVAMLVNHRTELLQMDPSWLSQTYWEMRKMGNKKAHLCELKTRALTAK